MPTPLQRIKELLLRDSSNPDEVVEQSYFENTTWNRKVAAIHVDYAVAAFAGSLNATESDECPHGLGLAYVPQRFGHLSVM